MTRPLETIKDINDSKYLWKVAVLVKDLWAVTNWKNIQHVEMVLTDKLGHEIQVIVPAELKDHFKEALAENQTFTVQNFVVEKNNMALKCADHPFKLIFNSATLIEEMNEHEIPHPGYKFKDFPDITSGKMRPDLCIDVIGVFHELGYTQIVPGNRKLQINFKLKDLKGNILQCTLWEDFAVQFQNYNKQRTEWGHTIIMIHNAKIKEATEKYELGVSNAWNATRLYINDNIPPIVEFRKSLSVDEGTSSQSQSLVSLSCGSQMFSPTSPLSQCSGTDKFLDKSTTLPLNKILDLQNNTICTTVARTTKLLPNTKGWYYKSCSKCAKAAKGETLPLLCPDGHETHAINIRYKLEFEAEYEGTTTKLVLWDRECNELLGKTAAELQLIMIEAGVTNPLEYPLSVDNICGRTFAIRTKWQPTWSSCSVQALTEDKSIIKKIIDLFPKNEETSKMMLPLESETPTQSNTDQIKDIVSLNDVVIPTQDLSATAEIDPFKPISVTPTKGKRNASDSAVCDNNNLDPVPTQLSSTKLKKNIKVEKKN